MPAWFEFMFQEPKDGTITCPDKNYFCFALWTENEVGNQTIISQGEYKFLIISKIILFHGKYLRFKNVVLLCI